MSDLESILRTLIREELRSTVEEILPQFTSQQITKQPEPEVELLLSTREAAKRLSISERTLFELTKSGQLPCVRLGMAKRYSVETIKKWIQKSEAEPDRPSISRPRQPNPGPTSQRPSPQRDVKRRETKKPQKKKPKPLSRAGPQAIPKSTVQRKRDDQTQPPNPLSLLLAEIGVDRTAMPKISNGDLMRIAEVDIPTLHGWQYLHRPMPEDAIEKLREHFRQFMKLE